MPRQRDGCVSGFAQPRSRPTFSSFYFLSEPSQHCTGAPRLALYHLAMWLTKIFPFAAPLLVGGVDLLEGLASPWPRCAVRRHYLRTWRWQRRVHWMHCSDLRLTSCLTDDKAVRPSHRVRPPVALLMTQIGRRSFQLDPKNERSKGKMVELFLFASVA